MAAATYLVGELMDEMDEMNNELFQSEFNFTAGTCGSGLSLSADHAMRYQRAAEIHFESFEGMVSLDPRQRTRVRCALNASAKLNRRPWMPAVDQKFSNPV